jgi:starch synthase
MSMPRVLFATSECVPWVKTGGLADVSAALPAGLRALGVDVRVLLPGYPGVLAAEAARLVATIPGTARLPACALLETQLPSGVPAYVVDCTPLFVRHGGLYQDSTGRDWDDNALRFGLFSRVAALLTSDWSPLAWRPQVLHCNDWQTGLAPAYRRYMPGARTAVVASIHNLAFQGIFDKLEVERLELPWEVYRADGVEFYGRMSFLKGAIHFADAITTVSPTYAEEIQHEALGFGMQGLLAMRRNVLHGIVNGIDTDEWNPATDPHLYERYDATRLDIKLANKRALQAQLGLAIDATAPLAGMVTRLTHQKGIDLVAAAMPALLAHGVQLAVLGSGQRELETALTALATAHPTRIAVSFAFDEPLARRIEAGADLFLMPSRFEPCGLNQMYSQRYGTPPVARATGGLVDTIVDATDATLADGTATGFLFAEATAAALAATVGRAIAVYRKPDVWARMQRAGMATDFGWEKSARRYLDVYRSALAP